MKAENGYWSPTKGFSTVGSNISDKAQLVLYFGENDILSDKTLYESFKKKFPKADILGCTTGGEIINDEVSDDSCVYIAMEFDKTKVKAVMRRVEMPDDSENVGIELAEALHDKDLKAILVLSEGLTINGSALVKGINSRIDTSKVIVSGGLAGDGTRFQKTLVGCNENPKSRQVAAIGLYGDDLIIQTGSEGGWEVFGPQRVITKSEGNVLYELDGKPALELYKKYLGEEAEKLPSSGLYFPLAIWPQGMTYEDSVIRTILAIDEDAQSIRFAGDMPQGYNVRLMWGKFDGIVDGAISSAKSACGAPQIANSNSVSIVISCLGRKALMGQRVIDEVEQVSKVLGNDNIRIGFYSYGEIARHKYFGTSVLHNQTMTITTLYEK